MFLKDHDKKKKRQAVLSLRRAPEEPGDITHINSLIHLLFVLYTLYIVMPLTFSFLTFVTYSQTRNTQLLANFSASLFFIFSIQFHRIDLIIIKFV